MAYVNLIDIVYPVGSVYISTSTVSPTITFGGTWSAINTFLYGNATPGSVGGATGHYHTLDRHGYARLDFKASGNWLNYFYSPISASYFSATSITSMCTNRYAVQGVSAVNPSTESFDSYPVWLGGRTDTSYGKDDNTQTLPPYTTVCIWQRTN